MPVRAKSSTTPCIDSVTPSGCASHWHPLLVGLINDYRSWRGQAPQRPLGAAATAAKFMARLATDPNRRRRLIVRGQPPRDGVHLHTDVAAANQIAVERGHRRQATPDGRVRQSRASIAEPHHILRTSARTALRVHELEDVSSTNLDRVPGDNREERLQVRPPGTACYARRSRETEPSNARLMPTVTVSLGPE